VEPGEVVYPSYSPALSPILVVPDKFTPTPVVKASTTFIS
jgi:hypothetical protein